MGFLIGQKQGGASSGHGDGDGQRGDAAGQRRAAGQGRAASGHGGNGERHVAAMQRKSGHAGSKRSQASQQDTQDAGAGMPGMSEESQAESPAAAARRPRARAPAAAKQSGSSDDGGAAEVRTIRHHCTIIARAPAGRITPTLLDALLSQPLQLTTADPHATADLSPLGPHALAPQPRASCHHTPGPVPAAGLHAGSCQEGGQEGSGAAGAGAQAVLPKKPQWLLYDNSDFAVLRR